MSFLPTAVVLALLAGAIFWRWRQSKPDASARSTGDKDLWEDPGELVSVVRFDPPLRGWTFQITIGVMEFVREQPLEGEMRRAIAAALGSVSGVTAVAEEDREAWVVQGSPKPHALLAAASAVSSSFDDRTASSGWKAR